MLPKLDYPGGQYYHENRTYLVPLPISSRVISIHASIMGTGWIVRSAPLRYNEDLYDAYKRDVNQPIAISKVVFYRDDLLAAICLFHYAVTSGGNLHVPESRLDCTTEKTVD